MHTRRWIRRGVAGVSLTIPQALAPSLEVTIRTARPHERPTISENDQAARVADVEDVRTASGPSGSSR
jgi:hypothetical protein